METKTFPSYTKEIKDRTVTGIVSVFGNIDSHGDRIHNGSFTKTIAERSDRFRFLWQHDFWSPPVAKITDIREIGKKDLPEKLRETEGVTGALEITRKYLNTERGNEIFEGLKEDAINEMSFAFNVMKWDYENIGTEENPRTIRNIREIEFWEGSDVNWGANPLTIADSEGKEFDLGIANIKSSIKNVLALMELLKEVDMDELQQAKENLTKLAEAEPELLPLTSIERRLLQKRIELAMLMEVKNV